MKSNSLFERSQKVSPGGVHSPVRAFKSVGGNPLFFDRGEGAHIFSVEGEKFIDFCLSFGPNILGHRDPDVAAVVEEVSHRAWSLGTCEPYSLELAEYIIGELPFLDKARFVCSGTEAVMSALRVARGTTGRNKILKFNGMYHGHVDGMLVKAGSGLAGEAASDSAGVSESVANETLVCDLDDEETVERVFAAHGESIAAVIIEPLPANFGLLPQRPEYLKFVFQCARNNNSLVIFDEVISGFRIGMQGMAGELGVEPDLLTYGKVMGGGFPVGCYAGKNKCMDQVAPSGPVYQAGTLAANPIGMAAGLATLKKVKQCNVHEVLKKRTADFSQALNDSFHKHSAPFQVTHKESLFWIHGRSDQPIRSPKDFPAGQSEKYTELFHGCLKRGVYMAPSAFEVGFMSFAHTESVLDQAISIISDAAAEVRGS